MDGVRLVRARALTGVASLGLAVVLGCSRDGGTKGAAANAGPYAKEVSEAVPKIEKAVGLTFKTPPRVERRSKEEVRNFLTQKFNESMPAAEISGIERTYRRFGLISDTLQLRPFMLELLTEQQMLFEAVWQRLTLAQRGALRAVVLQDGRDLLSSDTRTKHRLGAASSVQRSLEALANQDLVVKEGTKYVVVDSLFREWVARRTF